MRSKFLSKDLTISRKFPIGAQSFLSSTNNCTLQRILSASEYRTNKSEVWLISTSYICLTIIVCGLICTLTGKSTVAKCIIFPCTVLCVKFTVIIENKYFSCLSNKCESASLTLEVKPQSFKSIVVSDSSLMSTVN